MESEHARRAVGAFSPDKHRNRLARLRRGVGFAARAHIGQVDGFRPDTCFMLTLTYRPDEHWQPRHLSDFVKRFRRWLKNNELPCRYVWVAEIQDGKRRADGRGRGAVHYHVAVFLPAGVYLPKADHSGWWPHGSSRTERARAAVPYLMKYLSKGGHHSKFQLPNGARMFGVGGLEHSMRRAKRWLGLPAFVKARSDVLDDWKPARGGGWMTPDGHVIPSEFERAWHGDRWAIRRVVDYGRPFNPDGPFSWADRAKRA